MTLEWPVVVLIMFVILAVGVALGGPVRRRHALELAAIKAKGQGEYETLAKETRDALTAMQSDLAAVRASVQAIETMMRDVS